MNSTAARPLTLALTSLLALSLAATGCSKPRRAGGPKPAPGAQPPAPRPPSLVSPGGVPMPPATPARVLSLVERLDGQREAATAQLIAAGTAAAGAMRALLASPSVAEAGAALEYFAATGDPSGAEGAAELLASDVHSLRRQALLTLERIGTAKQLGAISARFEDPDAMVRSLAIRVATKLGGVASAKPLLDLLADRDEQVTVEAALALARVLGAAAQGDARREPAHEPAAGAPPVAPKGSTRRQEVISELTKLVAAPRPATAIGALTALEALGAAPPPEVVTTAAHHADERVAVAALRLVPLLEGPDAASVLTSALADPRADVRRVAVEESAVLPLDARREALSRATEDAAPAVRAAALTRYAALSKDPVAALLDGLRDQEPLVRATAVLALSKAGPKAGKPLVALLDTERDNTVRQALYRAAKRLQLKAAIPRLVALLQDPKTRTTNLVADTLEHLTGQHLGDDARAWKAWFDGQAGGGTGAASPAR